MIGLCLPLMLHALGTLPLSSKFSVTRSSATTDRLQAFCASHLELSSG